MQIVQGDLIRGFDEFVSMINHVQVADNPGRHKPGTGEINYDFIFAAVEQRAYDGWVGCHTLHPLQRHRALIGCIRTET